MTRLAPHGGCNWEGCKECFPNGKPAETWSIPPEPGPKVTHVRDSMISEYTTEGRLWQRRDNGKWARNDQSYGVSWYTLLGLGPLTDATEED